MTELSEIVDNVKLVEEPVAVPPTDTGDTVEAVDTTEATVAKAETVDSDDNADTGGTVSIKALRDERRKRQEERNKNVELQRELAYLRGRVESGFQEKDEGKGKKEAVYDSYYNDPVSYTNYVAEMAAQRAVLNDRIERSVEDMRLNHDDYDEKEAIFAEAARKNPELVQRMNKSPNPARYVYNWAKDQEEMSGVGSIAQLKKKIEADILAKLETERKKTAAIDAATQSPRTQASARGTGAKAAAAWAGPTSLSDIVGSGLK